MSEAEACFRIRAARVGRRFPLVLERLAAGSVHLSGIKLLAELFTEENHAALLDRVHGKTKRQIEMLVAELKPKPDVPARLRRLPARRANSVGLLNALDPAAPQSQQSLAAEAQPAALQSSLASQQPLAAAAQSAAHVSLPSQVPGAVGQPSALPPSATPTPFALQSPTSRASTKPLSPGRFKLEVTLGQEAHDELEQLQELLRHQNPSGDLASIIERAVSELLEREMKRRFAQTKGAKARVVREPDRSGPDATPPMLCVAGDPGRSGTDAKAPAQRVPSESDRSGTCAKKRQGVVASAPESVRMSSRYVPREVRREVYARDQGQCTFVSPEGRRCTARGFLELHHHGTTFARGGAATADNLRLACRAHNFFLAEKDYGRDWMRRKLEAAQRGARVPGFPGTHRM